MDKPRLAFVDHSYHRKTRTSDFLVEALETAFRVDRFWDEAWGGAPSFQLRTLNDREFAAIILFQIAHYHSAREVRQLRCRNVISVPMYDDVGEQDDGFWIQQSRYRHLTFSRTIHERLVRLGIPSLRLQYFPDPKEFDPVADFSALRGFFWQRTPALSWPTIRTLIGETRFHTFHLHLAPDPPHFEVPLPEKMDLGRHDVSVSNWFEDRRDFLAVLRQANVYFAPRLAEGIGMSFLEAMAAGQCVVAPDGPTMNEYITPGKTGLLYNPQRPLAMDFGRAREIGAAARFEASLGHQRWRYQLAALVDYVREPTQPSATNRASSRSTRRARARAWAQFVVTKFKKSPGWLVRQALRIRENHREKKKPGSSF